MAIDDDSFTELETYPWPREFHARLINILKEAGAKVIGLDILFSEPGPEPQDDEELARTLKEAGNCILAATFTEVDDPLYKKRNPNFPIPTLRENALSFGLVSVPYDPDAYVRSVRLREEHQGITYPSFTLEAIKAYLGLKAKNLSIPTDKEGTMLINFVGRPRSFKTISYYQVLNRMISLDIFKDKIVLVGATSDLLHDLFPTPFSESNLMPGVEIHANAIHTILRDDHIRRLSWPGNALILLFLSLMTSFGVASLRPFKGLLFIILEVSIFSWLCIYLFAHQRVWANLASPVITLGFIYSGIIFHRFIVEEHKKRWIRGILGRYINPAVMNEILANPEGLSLGGTRREISVLFSDIRGFTSMAEGMPPEKVIERLNEYFSAMVGVIFRYDGMLDKFIGDAIMAVYGAPINHNDDPQRAVRCAVEMGQELGRLKEKWQAEGSSFFDIGIHTGEAVVGNVGSQDRTEYTAIGDTVNLASRLEGLTKKYQSQIIISQETYERAKEILEVEYLGEEKVKGKEVAVKIYKVLGLSGRW